MKNNLPENEKALWILKTRGSLCLMEIAEEMGITTEGARFHLLRLANDGLVKSTPVSKGRGRPQQIWSLTDMGNARFPDAHADLTVRIISLMKETLGEQALEAVIEANEKQGINRYQYELKDHRDLEARIRKLAEVRNEEGYMAEYQKDEEGYLLIENHCPICAAATACQGFCRSELNTFRTLLGENVSIKRVDHILEGARRCAYRITAR